MSSLDDLEFVNGLKLTPKQREAYAEFGSRGALLRKLLDDARPPRLKILLAAGEMVFAAHRLEDALRAEQSGDASVLALLLERLDFLSDLASLVEAYGLSWTQVVRAGRLLEQRRLTAS